VHAASVGRARPGAPRRAGATAAADQVRYVDTAAWLCDADRGPLVVGDRLIDWDTHHLTVPYTRWLQPVVDEAVFGR
jgi:hypothetical protein